MRSVPHSPVTMARCSAWPSVRTASRWYPPVTTTPYGYGTLPAGNPSLATKYLAVRRVRAGEDRNVASGDDNTVRSWDTVTVRPIGTPVPLERGGQARQLIGLDAGRALMTDSAGAVQPGVDVCDVGLPIPKRVHQNVFRRVLCTARPLEPELPRLVPRHHGQLPGDEESVVTIRAHGVSRCSTDGPCPRPGHRSRAR